MESIKSLLSADKTDMLVFKQAKGKYMHEHYKQRFYDTYAKLLPRILKLESYRRTKLFEIFLVPSIITFFNLIIPILIACLSKNIDGAIGTFFLLLFINLFISIPFYISNIPKHSKDFSHIMKRYFFDDLFECFDFIKKDKYTLLHNKYLGDVHINWERYHAVDDSFIGCYNGVNFQIVEFNNIDKNCYSEVVIVLDFNKLIKSEIRISPKMYKYIGWIAFTFIFFMPFIFLYLKNYIGSILSFGMVVFILWMLFSKSKYEEIQLEDNNFNKKFYVLAEDQVEARYLLTTSFMERLKNLKTAFGSKYIWCTFKENKLTMQISTNNDLFEIGNLFTSTKNPKQINRFYDEIMAITEIIDHFKLNEKVGL